MKIFMTVRLSSGQEKVNKSNVRNIKAVFLNGKLPYFLLFSES